MATVIWNEKQQKWTLRVCRDGQYKTFASRKAGLQGKKEVLARYRKWDETGSVNYAKAICRVVYDKFLTSTAERLGRESESYTKHEMFGRLYILPSIGAKRMYSLRKADFQDILNNAKPRNKRTQVLTKKYLKNMRVSINAFIEYSIENGYIEPFYGSPLYIPVGHPTKGKNILQPDDIRELFKPSDLTYHKALCFMVCTGVRPSECIGLKWSDIQNDVIYIRRGINSKNIITEGKNENARRTIPLTTLTRQLLAIQKENTKHLKSEWIFCDKVGGAGKQNTMYHQLTVLGKERGFKNSLYEMRHTFASLLKDSALSEFMMKQIFGHSSFTDTFGIYGHLINGDMQKAAEIIELKFKDISQETGE